MLGTASHGGDTMTEVVAHLHERYPGLRITITEDLEQLRLDNLKNYDVLCINRLRVQEGNPPDHVKEGIVEFMKQGGWTDYDSFRRGECAKLARLDPYFRRHVGDGQNNPQAAG
jgi:hypothetical protein